MTRIERLETLIASARKDQGGAYQQQHRQVCPACGIKTHDTAESPCKHITAMRARQGYEMDLIEERSYD